MEHSTSSETNSHSAIQEILMEHESSFPSSVQPAILLL
jgi:hypothetical protein